MTTAVVADIQPASLNVEDIGELLVSVNQVTARLQATHEALREQVDSLQGELAAANEQLRRSRSLAALGEMAAGIAHEIRNPLGSILLYVQMLEADLHDRPQLAGVCGKVNEAVRRMDAIVKDVLAFARDRSTRPEPVSIASLCAAAIASCEQMLQQRDISVDVGVEPADAVIEADANLLIQALSNLLRNSIEAITEHGCSQRRVWLSASAKRLRLADGRRAERMVLAVEDSGPGIRPDIARRMFNPFFTTRATGTGLGLAIVHRIVDAHGGEVDVAAREGGGSRIELRLPPRAPRPDALRPERFIEPKTSSGNSPALDHTLSPTERIA